MQPDKDGKVEEPIFPSDEKPNKSKNEGLDFLMGL